MATLAQIQQQNPAFIAVPNAQGFFNDGSSLNTPIGPQNTINTNVLNQNGNQPQLPQTQPIQTPQQFLAGLQPLQIGGGIQSVNPMSGGAVQQTTNQLNTLEGGRGALQQRLLAASNQLLGKGGEQLRLEQQFGIQGLNKDVLDLNEQIVSKKAAFDQAAMDVTGKPIGIERQTGKIAQIQRNEAVQIGGLSALMMAKQGRLDSAKAEVDRTLALEFDPIKQDIENTKTFLDLNYQDMTRVEKRQSDALKVQLDREARDVNNFQSMKEILLKDALSNNPNMVGSLINAKSFSDLAALNQSTFDSGTPSEKVEALNTTVNLLDTIKDSSGLNTRVGPNSLTRRFLGIGDSFGAGDAFAGSVHQLTSQETLNTLLQLKAQGGTLGALSDQERIMLQNAATKISAWERKDKQGNGQGTWDISEKEFNKELARLKELTQTAIIRAGGAQPVLSSQDMEEAKSLLQVPGEFNALNYYQ